MIFAIGAILYSGSVLHPAAGAAAPRLHRDPGRAGALARRRADPGADPDRRPAAAVHPDPLHHRLRLLHARLRLQLRPRRDPGRDVRHAGADARDADAGPRLPVRADQHDQLLDHAARAERRRQFAVRDAAQRRRVDRHLARDGGHHGAHPGPAILPFGAPQPVQPGLHRLPRPHRADAARHGPRAGGRARPGRWAGLPDAEPAGRRARLPRRLRLLRARRLLHRAGRLLFEPRTTQRRPRRRSTEP